MRNVPQLWTKFADLSTNATINNDTNTTGYIKRRRKIRNAMARNKFRFK